MNYGETNSSKNSFLMNLHLAIKELGADRLVWVEIDPDKPNEKYLAYKPKGEILTKGDMRKLLRLGFSFLIRYQVAIIRGVNTNHRNDLW